MFRAHDTARLRNQPGVQPEVITFYSKTTQGGFSSGAVLWRSQKSCITKDMIEGGRLIQRQIVNFRVYSTDLAASSAAIPKADDKIVDSNGSTYIIPRVQVEMLGQVFLLADCQLLPG